MKLRLASYVAHLLAIVSSISIAFAQDASMPRSDPLTDALERVKQDAKAPHPGTLTIRSLWNKSEVKESSESWPDGNIFFCWNEKDEVVSRNKAKWCVPLVEFETLSVDEAGKPVPPNHASFISRKEYGPNHTFVRSVSTPPVRVPPPELRAPDTNPSAPASAPKSSALDAQGHTGPTQPQYPQTAAKERPASWWATIKQWARRA